MGIFRKLLLTTTAIGAGAGYFITTNYIYTGKYLEEAPYSRSQKSPLTKFYHQLGLDTGDDVKLSKSVKIANPLHNPSAYDYYETRLTAEETKKFFTKFPTAQDRILQLQKHTLLGPTLYFHRFVISPYFRDYMNGARMSAFSHFEPKLTHDQSKPAFNFPQPIFPPGLECYEHNPQLNYVWTGDDVVNATKPLTPGTVIYGMFSALGNGVRAGYGGSSKAGYWDFSFGGDLIAASMVHRVEYYTVLDEKSEENLVIRLTNVAQLSGKNAPQFVDDTNGLHEFMTRTIVWDVVRGIQSELRD
ncbi:hypothetical protein WICPIJ_007539 [Wickerhamomyces pijperi]|uniref:Uncharacterized protein n=1 Tax=Wickerhamomyces pijperi TaxID=599730 RepID=A0A9P8Q1E9_WICPI|nr:hypothetical protein WICPIJ_007539 [Wickerhamomyces pijperi]